MPRKQFHGSGAAGLEDFLESYLSVTEWEYVELRQRQVDCTKKYIGSDLTTKPDYIHVWSYTPVHTSWSTLSFAGAKHVIS